MISRRQLRTKVLQALYAWYQSDHSDQPKMERDLMTGIDKLYELYLYNLALLPELAELDRIHTTDSKQKYFPTDIDISKANRLADNPVVHSIINSPYFKAEIKKYKVSWQNDMDMVKQVYTAIRKSDEYAEQLRSDDHTEVSAQAWLLKMFKLFIGGSEPLRTHFEEKNIFWNEDNSFINSMVSKTITTIKCSEVNQNFIMPIMKDAEDDTAFVKELFRATIRNDKETEKLISERTKNWDVERIALVDIILIKMALSEIKAFPQIPVKVSINEYIDISKDYSTPKSKAFINGIIDKLVTDMKEKNEIVKTGRGLIE